MHHVPKLSHVAWPVVLREHLERAIAEALRTPLGLNEVLEKRLREELDVIAAISQRSEIDLEHLQPVVQVGAQLPFVDRLLDVAVARGQDAHIDLNRLFGSNASQRVRLEHAQQLDLQLDRHLGDFVEEERAARGLLELALVSAFRAGEAPALVTEQLAFHERWRDRTAIHRHPGAVATAAQFVNGAATTSLPDPLSPVIEHARAARRNSADQLARTNDRVRSPDNPHETSRSLLLRTKLAQLVWQSLRLRNVLQNLPQPFHVEWLGQVVGHSATKGLNRRVQRPPVR